MKHTRIAVVESRWHHPGNNIKRNTTIRPLFEFLSNLHCGHHHGFEYEMVGTQPALAEALGRLAKSRDVSVAYLAMHGDEGGRHLHLHGRTQNIVSRAQLRETLRGITREKGARLRGLFLGACMVGTTELAEFLLDDDVKIDWVAGYREAVEFVQSTALDLLFFNLWLAAKTDDQDISERKRIEAVADRMALEVPGLIRTPAENNVADAGLGFAIFARRRGPHRGVQDLLRP